jgi:hypothetical protein
VQRLEPERGRISYRVVVGLHRGATSIWTVTPSEDGAASVVAVTGHADQPYADLLLADLKRAAEGGSLSGN